MIRATLLSTLLAAAVVTPALATDTMTKADGMSASNSLAQRGPIFTERQARVHLARQGYVNISSLTRDGNGAWRGTAKKSGKALTVAVKFNHAAFAN